MQRAVVLDQVRQGEEHRRQDEAEAQGPAVVPHRRAPRAPRHPHREREPQRRPHPPGYLGDGGVLEGPADQRGQRELPLGHLEERPHALPGHQIDPRVPGREAVQRQGRTQERDAPRHHPAQGPPASAEEQGRGHGGGDRDLRPQQGEHEPREEGAPPLHQEEAPAKEPQPHPRELPREEVHVGDGPHGEDRPGEPATQGQRGTREDQQPLGSRQLQHPEDEVEAGRGGVVEGQQGGERLVERRGVEVLEADGGAARLVHHLPEQVVVVEAIRGVLEHRGAGPEGEEVGASGDVGDERALGRAAERAHRGADEQADERGEHGEPEQGRGETHARISSKGDAGGSGTPPEPRSPPDRRGSGGLGTKWAPRRDRPARQVGWLAGVAAGGATAEPTASRSGRDYSSQGSSSSHRGLSQVM